MNKIDKDIMLGMISILNEAIEAHKNGNPIMTDEQFGIRMLDLKQFEEETGFILSNSPIPRMVTKVVIESKETESIHKTSECNTVNKVIKFANNKDLLVNIKLDGIPMLLTYNNGVLVKCNIRNNNNFDFDIDELINKFVNVPLKISKKETYIIGGEAVIVNEKLKFFVQDILNDEEYNLFDNLHNAEELGFDVAPYWVSTTLNPKKLQSNFEYVFEYAKEENLPCDGIMFRFNDIEYAKSLNDDKRSIIYKEK